METYTLSGLDFSPELNMARYLQSIRRYPVLDQEEEQSLAKTYRLTKDQQIANRLILSHLRLVVKVVSKYKGYGLPLSEMISEGNIGLIYAVEKFDPDKGFRFSTYALWWIKASVQKYILNSWSLVKVGTTAAQKKLFFNLRKAKNQLSLMEDRELSEKVIHSLAHSLSVTPKEVKEMNVRLSSRDGSLNSKLSSSSEDEAEWQDFLADKTPNQEEKTVARQQYIYRKKLFVEALGKLNRREKEILFKRRLQDQPLTLEELSSSYQISKERVRQIELNSILKLQKYINGK